MWLLSNAFSLYLFYSCQTNTDSKSNYVNSILPLLNWPLHSYSMAYVAISYRILEKINIFRTKFIFEAEIRA